MAGTPDTIERIRTFNRFYTRHLGLLDECFLARDFSLPEIRVLYEIAHERATTATSLAEYLRMDPGYVSRILGKLLKRMLLQRKTDPEDRRRKQLKITPQGKRQLQALDQLARNDLEKLLTPLTPEQQDELAQQMHRIQQLLASESRQSLLIRLLKPGDIGTIINRHALLYAEEQGWDEQFEKAVLAVLSSFVSQQDQLRERGWVAEVDGAFAGSIFAVKEDAKTARLRALLVEPRFRGLGIGRQLIEQCVDFCQHCGYRRITLWTCSDLVQARKLYALAGFTLIDAWPEEAFGQSLTGERWDKILQPD